MNWRKKNKRRTQKRGKTEDEIILTDALTEPLEIAGIESFSDSISHGITGSEAALNRKLCREVLLAILVYVVASKIIHKLCKLIVASMNRANADTGVTQFLSSFAKAAMYFFLIVSIATSFGVVSLPLPHFWHQWCCHWSCLAGGLSNLAGGVIILILRPFVIGDYIIENSGKQEGTVVKIDLFTQPYPQWITEELPFQTSAYQFSIVNVTAKDNRKLEIKVGISYQADLKKAKKILETLLHEDASIMSDQEMQVFVDELAADSVILGLRAWVKTEEYWATKWRLNEKIKLTFDEQGIEIPFPQLDVHIK